MSPRLRICPAPGCGHLRPCAQHPAPTTSRGRAHRKARAQTLREEHICWLCGQPGTAADPLTADHIIPRAHGGIDHRDNMRAAHASCNKKRSTHTPEKISSDRSAPRTLRPLLAASTGLERYA